MRNPGGLGGKKMTSCCSKVGIKKGPWTPEEDQILSRYIKLEGEGAWRTLPKRAGLLRCGKSCRLRWMNYLRPHLNRTPISPDEEDLILRLHRLLGNRWALIAGRIPGRTDNEIKNYWNTHLSKKLISQGLDPRTHKPLEIYNPKPNPIKLATASSTSMAPSPPPLSFPVVLGQEQANENEDARAEQSDGMMMTTTMEDYNEDMYFSSFLDSIMMGDYGRQFDDSNQHVLFQEMTMMQPMNTYEPNLQGLDWGYQTQRDLDPAEMERK